MTNKTLGTLLLGILAVGTLEAALTKHEEKIALRSFKNDQLLRKKFRAADEQLLQRTSALQVFLNLHGNARTDGSCQDQCEALCDDNDGGGNSSGSEACWQACSNEGWSSSTCADRCGVSTSGGSQACWGKCSEEGWSSSTCADRCGTSTSGGSGACWNKCSDEGWSSSTCADRCGVSTSGGSEACWQHCTSEGWSSSTCVDRCGAN